MERKYPKRVYTGDIIVPESTIPCSLHYFYHLSFYHFLPSIYFILCLPFILQPSTISKRQSFLQSIITLLILLTIYISAILSLFIISQLMDSVSQPYNNTDHMHIARYYTILIPKLTSRFFTFYHIFPKFMFIVCEQQYNYIL